MEQLNNPFIAQIMNSAHSMFCIKYTTSICKKRRFLLYYVISLLTEHIPTGIDLIDDKNIITIVNSKLDIIYKQIKANEESPNTDYLFANLAKDNTYEQSMKRISIMNNIDFTPQI
jgi:hypothetical protein